MSRGWATSTWMAALSVASLLLATAMSFAVWWLPRPAEPLMNLGETLQVMRGQRSAASAGLLLDEQSRPPSGQHSAWVDAVVAAQLQQPVEKVRAVWSQRGTVPSVQVVQEGRVLDDARQGPVAALLLPDLRLPAFSLGLQLPDGRWRIVTPGRPDLAAWRWRVLLALLGSVLLTAPLVAWASLRLSRPLQRLTRASEQLSLHEASPVTVEGPRDVRTLAVAINTGRERLQQQAHEVTRMLAAVAHDLRTPLTGLRLRAEFAPPAQSARMVADITRMDRMIEEVLQYARGQLQDVQRHTLDLVALLQEIMQGATSRGVRVEGTWPAALTVEGDPLLLRRALDNLIDNAARYAGAAEIEVFAADGGVCIDVLDRGPGIEPTDRERLLQPFQRREASRSADTGGTGLGLAIAVNAIRAHGGTLQLQSRDGGGLRVRLWLPVAG